MDTPTYLYRCTEQQLEEHLQRVAEEGDVVEHVIFKGGRDYVLVCRKAADQGSVVAALNVVVDELQAIRTLLESTIQPARPRQIGDLPPSHEWVRRGPTCGGGA